MHPEEGKQGVNISRKKYDLICDAILAKLEQIPEISFKELVSSLEEQMMDEFEGSIPWYVTTVKLDLEAREMIERVPDSSPERLRIPD
jgi:hypothetical protein